MNARYTTTTDPFRKILSSGRSRLLLAGKQNTLHHTSHITVTFKKNLRVL